MQRAYARPATEVHVVGPCVVRTSPKPRTPSRKFVISRLPEEGLPRTSGGGILSQATAPRVRKTSRSACPTRRLVRGPVSVEDPTPVLADPRVNGLALARDQEKRPRRSDTRAECRRAGGRRTTCEEIRPSALRRTGCQRRPPGRPWWLRRCP